MRFLALLRAAKIESGIVHADELRAYVLQAESSMVEIRTGGVDYDALMEDGGLAQENANRTQKAAYAGWTVNDDVPSRASVPYSVS